MNGVRKVTEDLYWVGVNDKRIELFENIHPIRHADRREVCREGQQHRVAEKYRWQIFYAGRI